MVAIMLAPALAFSADKFATSTAVVGDDASKVIVPLNVTNEDGLMAIDIPLKYSEGVTLREVTFEGTRTEYFDLKVFNIDNDKNIVIIGLVSQITSTRKPMLEAGEGTVANLVFEVTDPSVSSVTIEATELENPHHRLMYVYNRREEGQLAHVKSEPKFEPVTVALSGVADGLPTSYSLGQNYPNPFNPSTEIAFSLPASGHVQLSVYNVLGQQVNTLVDRDMSAGNHTITWDGRGDDGSSVASGVYFYRLKTAAFSETKKMMMLK